MQDDVSWRVIFAPHFMKRLATIEEFLEGAGAPTAYDALLDAIEAKVIRNLLRFPKMGRLYANDPPLSIEGVTQMADLPLEGAKELREYLQGDYSILYAPVLRLRTINLISIRHQRELSYYDTR